MTELTTSERAILDAARMELLHSAARIERLLGRRPFVTDETLESLLTCVANSVSDEAAELRKIDRDVDARRLQALFATKEVSAQEESMEEWLNGDMTEEETDRAMEEWYGPR